jgi:hypothetical protein
LFQFLNPIWFFGAAALVIPVLIHLWNIRSGKVLRVGSISLIQAASRKSSRSFKLLDIPLFILRCLLLLLLALLLALPVWQKKVQAAKVKGWVLFPKENFTATYQKFKPIIDSLTKAGYEFHYFNAGFAKSNLTQIFLNRKDSIITSLPAPKASQPNYWSLVNELDNKVSSDLPVYIFMPNQTSYFTGTKPQVAMKLNWQTYTPADSAINFIHDAWFTHSGDVRVIQGHSKPSGINYTFNNVQANDKANADYIIATVNGKATISLPQSKQQAIAVDTATQRIIIYADNNATDANYLKAALLAVTQFTQRRYVLKMVNNPGQIPAKTQWLFWLSEKPINQQVLKNTRHLFTYEKGKAIAVSTWMNNGGQFTTALPHNEKIDLYKLIKADKSYTPLWQDGFGYPVLSVQQSGQANIYHYYSRFNPAWNNLVWSDAFPAWLLKLTAEPAKTDIAQYDRRVLSTQQYMPQILSEIHTVTDAKPLENKSLARYFWLAIIIVFAAERWLAHRTPKTVNA